MKCVAFLSSLILVAAAASQANAAVLAKIDISSQTMQVVVQGKTAYTWPVSTARAGYRTPTGQYRPTRMHQRYFSRRYNNAPMPHSIFFYKGYAIHGTNEIKHIGRPASRGCIRLHPDNAAKLFSLVQRHGMGNTRIVLSR